MDGFQSVVKMASLFTNANEGNLYNHVRFLIVCYILKILASRCAGRIDVLPCWRSLFRKY